MASKTKKFDFSQIQSDAKAIIDANGVDATNEISGLIMRDTDSGEPIGSAVAVYDGLAVLCAVNEDIFANASTKHKQVIAQKFLMLKPASVIEIAEKKYKVIEVQEFNGCFVALVQAA